MIGGEVPADIPRCRDVGLVAVLLEEHPLQHLRAAELRGRHEARTFGQVPHDGVGFEQVGAVVQLEGRDAPVGIALEEFRGACLALVDVDLGPLVLHAELRQQQADLEAVAGIQVVEEVHGRPVVRLGQRSIGGARKLRDGEGFWLRLSYSLPRMPRRLPPLNALRAFEASARLGSFVAAAAELRVSAAAVSQQVRRLEHYLDTTLFQRLARGLVLTDQGRDYLPELTAGFALLGESTARLRSQRTGGVLTLTTLAAFANGWLLPRLARFRERAPRIEVLLRTSRSL